MGRSLFGHAPGNFLMDEVETIEAIYASGVIADLDLRRKFELDTSGTCSETKAGSCVDSTNSPFKPDDVGRYIRNTTDTTIARITGFVNTTEVTVDTDVFANAETFVMDGRWDVVVMDVPGSDAVRDRVGPQVTKRTNATSSTNTLITIRATGITDAGASQVTVAADTSITGWVRVVAMGRLANPADVD